MTKSENASVEEQLAEMKNEELIQFVRETVIQLEVLGDHLEAFVTSKESTDEPEPERPTD